jgi:protein involved in polysaccharide export with SLBB domain
MFGMVQASEVYYNLGAGNTNNTTVVYAFENIENVDTDLNLPPVEYQMDLVVDPNEDFTLVFDFGEDGLFEVGDPNISVVNVNANLDGAYNTSADATNSDIYVSCARRRGGQGSNEVAFACNIASNTAANNINFIHEMNIRVGGNFDNHNLTSAGDSGTLELGVWDWTESARVDFSGDQTLNFQAQMASGFGQEDDESPVLASDTGTTVDATLDNPLTGFVEAGGTNFDNVYNATGNVDFVGAEHGINSAASNELSPRQTAAPGTVYNLEAGDTVEFNIADDASFAGLANVYFTPEGGGNVEFTVAGDNSAATVDLIGTNFQSGDDEHNVSFLVDGNTVLGTSRTFEMSANLQSALGGKAELAYGGGRSDWWVWDSNGTVLQSPLFNMPGAPWVGNFVLTNTGTSDADFTITLQGETGTTITPGSTTSDTIPANGTLVLPVSSVVDSISGGVARGTAIFTVSSAAQNITGLYQLVNPTAGSISNHVMGQVAAGGVLR